VSITHAPIELDATVLADIATRIGRAEWMWRSATHHDPDRRRPVRLLATPAYEVWVIGWTAGQALELHDHGDAAGLVLVLEGTLDETVLEDGVLIDQRLVTGRFRHLPRGIVHAVANGGSAPATSLHVYSPPLTQLTRFDPTTLRPTEVERVDNEAPVHPRSTASMLLHLHADD
jgi:predicted metal-dependent enzyme (double-stranded beta helix superfamily)